MTKSRCLGRSARQRMARHRLGPIQKIDVADAPLRARRRGRLRHRRRRLGGRRAAAAAGARGLPCGRHSRPGRSGTPSATGSATRPARTSSTGTTCASPAGAIRWRSAPTTAAGASAAARSTGRPSRRASIRRTSVSTPRTASAPTGRSPTGISSPTTSCWSSRCPSPGRPTIPGATRTAIPTARIRWAASATRWCAAARARHPRRRRRPGGDHLRLARRPAALHLSRLLHPGLQGRREAEHADHPCARRHPARRRDPRPTAWSARVNMGKDGRVTGVTYFDPEGHEREQTRKGRHRLPAIAIETPRLLLNSACPGFENGLANSSGIVGKYLMAQAGNVVAGPLRRAGPHVQGAARPRADRGVLRDRSRTRLRARLRHPDRRPAAHRLRQADDGGEGRLGLGHAPRDDGLQPLGGVRPARRDSALGGQPRRAGRGEGSASACRVAKSPSTCTTTTRS